MIDNRDWSHRLGNMLIASLLLLSGCSSLGGAATGSHQEITIDSDPRSATVYAEGTRIGVTPLVIRPDKVFQARFTMGDSETGGIAAFRYVGILSVEKAGCKSYTTQVNDNILARDIQVTLDCDPAYISEKPQPPPEQVPAPASRDILPDAPAGDAEARLLRIESLYGKGLLSEEEYRHLRQRVLDTL